MSWTGGGETNIQKEFGRDWIFGRWLAQEIKWCQAVYQQFAFRRFVADPAWLAHNDGALVKLAALISRSRRWEELPLFADALEEAGCTDQPVLAHLRGPGPFGKGCHVLNDILGRM